MATENPYSFAGLTHADVVAARRRYGENNFVQTTGSGLWHAAREVFTEPMFLLLVCSAAVYFIAGANEEAWFMLGAIIIVAFISLYQGFRSRSALKALQAFTQPHAMLIRNNQVISLPAEEIVVGDYLVASEGELIAADGYLRQSNDFSVNESILTGEAFSVFKYAEGDGDAVFKGTVVTSGQCVLEVSAVGAGTRLGQIGLTVGNVSSVKTPLQTQIRRFVRRMAFAGTAVCVLICLINWLRSYNLTESLLRGLTIAMSVLPEEIPVAFVSFMALGAYRLMQLGIVVKQPATVEALGAMTVICTDKTGTITENRMEVFSCYVADTDRIYKADCLTDPAITALIRTAMWASEIVPFDPMELALHQLYTNISVTDERPLYHMIREYPLSGMPPMMTHVFENAQEQRVIACKGAVEAVLQHTSIDKVFLARIRAVNSSFAKQGLRVLAVATGIRPDATLPDNQEDFSLQFQGLVAFYDPPKRNIQHVFRALSNAGIRIKLVTGDNPETAVAIGRLAGVPEYEHSISGTELNLLQGVAFDAEVRTCSIFSRIDPELKLRIVSSLERQGAIVAMIGDGVNDGPALKAAHIGIAMGARGSEVAKSAASLVLSDDNLGNIVDGIAMGRRIYINLKKAVQYIISIHVPIILTVAVPSILNWRFPAIFTPIHVIFLELIMGPTCSIVYEREPAEPNSMQHPPRPMAQTFLSMRELIISILQGLGITAGTLFIYQYGCSHQNPEELIRSMVFSTLISANIFLTLVNRSFYYSVTTTLRYKNKLLWVMISLTIILLLAILYIPSFNRFFGLIPLGIDQLAICIITALICVGGFEIYKLRRRMKH